MKRPIAALIALAILLAAACSGEDKQSAAVTTIPGDGDPEGILFAVDGSDDGARLRIRVGDDIQARFVVESSDDPAWRVSIGNPGVVTAGDRIRFLPSETGAADPYDEYLFRAVHIGETEITFDHPVGPKTVIITVIVYGN